jgi:hypothetical protein
MKKNSVFIVSTFPLTLGYTVRKLKSKVGYKEVLGIYPDSLNESYYGSGGLELDQAVNYCKPKDEYIYVNEIEDFNILLELSKTQKTLAERLKDYGKSANIYVEFLKTKQNQE